MDITLALGGGGSRGFAHVGVLRRLEQEGYHIRAVAGTSAGGIIAALYAAEYTPDEMEAMFNNLDQSKLFGHTSKDGPGLLGLSGAGKVLEQYFGACRFEDLKLPCAVVAVDIQTGKETVLKQGRIVDALMATIAVPGIFPPKEYQGTQLVDGAVLNPVPVCVARQLVPSLPVVAVVLDADISTQNYFPNLPLPLPVPATLVQSFTRTRVAQSFGIFLKSVDIGSRKLTELRLKEDNPELIIYPDVGRIGILDNVKVSELVRLGEIATEKALSGLKQTLTWSWRLRRKVFNNKR